MVRDPSMLTCREVVDALTDFLSDAMSPDDRIRLEQHLLICPPCTVHLGQVRSTIALTRGLGGEAEPGVEPPSDLMDLFRQWSERAR